jgi:hypothetical protein
MALGPLIVFGLNVVSAVVALLTSYYAYRFSRVADNPLLNSIAFGFMLLGVGLLIEAGTSAAVQQTLVRAFLRGVLAAVETYAYLSLQMVAYLVFAVGYAAMAFRGSKQAAALGVTALAITPLAADVRPLYSYAVVSYFVVLVLLAFVVFQGALIHSRSPSRFSKLVLLAFLLILAAHVVLLVSVVDLSEILFLVGTAVQFLGFASLFAFLLRSGRVGAG